MKKILYIANYKGPVGGISGQVSLLEKYVRKEGVETRIFSTIGNPFKRIGLFIKLCCISHRYDVLHVHGCSERGFLPIMYGIIAGKLSRKRVVVTYHGGGADAFFSSHSKFVKRWLCRADIIIVLSGFLKEVFDRFNIPCVVIPNILEDKDSGVHEIGDITIEPKFISLRHLRELYNISCVLRAFKRVQEQIPEASLVLLGQGDQREMLEQYVADNNLQNVHFVGQVPQQEVASYLEEASIMLSAPRIDNMPVSVMEAMQQGILVISSRVGGVPYVIEDGKTGLLFEYDNDAEMAEKMIWALQHQDDAQKIIQAAAKEVKKYSWEQICPQMFHAYGIKLEERLCQN